MSAPEQSDSDDGAGSGERAQSETVGFLLIIGLVLLGSLVIVLLGGVAIDTAENRLSEERAINSLTQVDSKAALVALGESSAHDISFGTGANTESEISVEDDNGWMRVTVTNVSSENEIQVMNLTLGALVHEGEETRLAYQGGGVWRSDGDGGRMVSPPEFHYRGATLTLPAITVSGDGVLNDEATVERESVDTIFPDPDVDELSNPLDSHIVNVTVGGEFYRGWSQYFAERANGEVAVDADNQTTKLTLVSPIGDVTVEGALAGQRSTGTLTVQGNPHHPCSDSGSHPPYIDSFNSSRGSYCDQYDPDEIEGGDDLTFGGDIITDASAGQVQANLVSGGSMDLAGQMDYYGNFSYTDSCVVSSGPAKDCEDLNEDRYVVTENNGVSVSDDIGFVVENTVEQLRDAVDETAITGGDTLTAGEYYTENISLDSENVTLDTADGDIEIAVNGTMAVTDGSTVSVTGDGTAEIYVQGAEGQDDFQVKDGDVTAPNDTATKMTVMGGGNFVGKVVDGGEFAGTIYAPAGEEGSGEVIVERKGTVYGAIVTGDMTLGEPSGGVGGSVHFDSELVNKQVVPPNKSIIPVTFVHITENHVSFNS